MQLTESNKVLLSPRLMAIANYAIKYNVVADIGCDHGKISGYLAQKNVFVHASDISYDSLEKTRLLAEELKITDKIKCYKSDGMKNMDGINLDSIIIAGMGELTIIKIINESIQQAKNASSLILQPMDGTYRIRKYLQENSFLIIEEDLVIDDRRYYTIIKARFDTFRTLSQGELILGPRLIEKRHPLLPSLIDKKIKIKQKIISNMKKSKIKTEDTIAIIQDNISILKQIKKDIT